MYNALTGIILAGGRSLRMGTNKSFLKIGEHTVIENLVSLMSNLFPKVLLITNEPALYANLNVDIFEDVYKFKGPLAGIHSGLLHSETQRNFVISCDIPLITDDVIKFIVDYPSDKPVVITKADGFIQQLCGVYDLKCIPAIESIFAMIPDEEDRDDKQIKRKCRVLSLVEKMGGTIIDIEKEYPAYKPNTFLNMNKPNDYEMLLNILSENN